MFSAPEKCFKTYNTISFLSGRQTKPGVKTSILLKTIAMAITFHMPPWLPMCHKWLQCYRSYRAEIILVNLHLWSDLTSIIFITVVSMLWISVIRPYFYSRISNPPSFFW